MMKKINVFGKEITIKYKKISGDLDGYYCKDKFEIYIDNTLKGNNKIHTEWHEVGHAFLHRLGWEEVMDDNTCELFCEQLGTMLTELGCKLK